MGAETSIAESCMSLFSRFLCLGRFKYYVLSKMLSQKVWCYRIKTKVQSHQTSPFIPGILVQKPSPSWAQLSLLGLKQRFNPTGCCLLSSEYCQRSNPSWVFPSIHCLIFQNNTFDNTSLFLKYKKVDFMVLIVLFSLKIG